MIPNTPPTTIRPSEQVRVLHSAIPVAVITNLLIALITVVVIWDAGNRTAIVIWGICFFCVQLTRLTLWFVMRRDIVIDDRRWLNLLRGGALLTGIAWGLPLATFLFPSDFPIQVFLAFVAAGVTGAAVASLAPDRISVLLFVTPVLLPLIVRIFMVGDKISMAMGTMGLLYLGYLVVTARRSEYAFQDTLALRESLQRQNAELRAAQQLARLGSWSLDVGSGKIHWSDEVYNIFERDPALFKPDLTTYYQGLVHPDDVESVKQEELAVFNDPGKRHSIDHRIMMPDGSLRWVHVEGEASVGLDGKPNKITGMVQDITERKRVEEMKSEFVSTVSHELRTPLTSICGTLGLLTGGALGKLPEKTEQMIDIAHKNSERLAYLINDLLDMEKLMAGKMQFNIQIQPLAPVIEQTIRDNQDYASQQGVRLLLEMSNDEILVEVDAQRLQQVLTNLISNATKYSPEGEDVEINLSCRHNSVRVEVLDHGPGISEAFRGQIFQKFARADASNTRQKDGTGLGLAISRELIERMGGNIGFDSAEGQGACFYFDLPLAGDRIQ